MKVLIPKRKLDKITNMTRLFKENGYELYLTGGAVRELLLNKKPTDFEFATNAKPRIMQKIMSGYNSTLIKQLNMLELKKDMRIRTYSIKKYKGYNDEPDDIKIVDTLKEDLSDRDFTINAIALDPMYLSDISKLHKHIVDPFNGLKDLRMKIIRFVGIPNERVFNEPIVLVKALRYAVHIHGKFHISTMIALSEFFEICVEFIDFRLFKEELYKVLKTERPSRFFYMLKDFGVLSTYFPNLARCYGLVPLNSRKEDVFMHSMVCCNNINPKFPLLRLAGIYHDIGKIEKVWSFHEDKSADLAFNDLRQLKFSKAEMRYIYHLIKQHETFLFQTSPRKTIIKELDKLKGLKVDWRDWMRLKFANRRANFTAFQFKLKDLRVLVKKIHDAENFKEVKKDNSSLKNNVLRRDNNTCQKCNSTYSLNAYSIDGVLDIEVCITLCDNCFNKDLSGLTLIREYKNEFSIKNLLINGYDIMTELNLNPGRRVGNLLNKLVDIVKNDKKLNNRDTLLHIVRNI